MTHQPLRSRRDAQPVRAVDATTREVTKDAGPAIPGPYGIPPRPGYPYNTGSGYPYSGGRGRGYGRTRHGYGTGYPGYRGLGGGRYPHHRQFGNPPLYPAQPAVSDPSTVTE